MVVLIQQFHFEQVVNSATSTKPMNGAVSEIWLSIQATWTELQCANASIQSFCRCLAITVSKLLIKLRYKQWPFDKKILVKLSQRFISSKRFTLAGGGWWVRVGWFANCILGSRKLQVWMWQCGCSNQNRCVYLLDAYSMQVAIIHFRNLRPNWCTTLFSLLLQCTSSAAASGRENSDSIFCTVSTKMCRNQTGIGTCNWNQKPFLRADQGIN